MHPEVLRAEPGSCPICGMALEPRHVTEDDDTGNPELAEMTRRFWLAAAFTLPLVVVAMGDLLPGEPISRMLSPRARTLLELGSLRQFVFGPRGLSTFVSSSRSEQEPEHVDTDWAGGKRCVRVQRNRGSGSSCFP